MRWLAVIYDFVIPSLIFLLIKILAVPKFLNENRYKMMEVSKGLQMYRLDISKVLSLNPCVTWLPSKCTSVFGSPSYSPVYYSLISARSELILFGGIDRKVLSLHNNTSRRDHRSHSLSGTLAFITISNIPL